MHKTLLFVTNPQKSPLKAFADFSGWVGVGLNFGLSFHLHPYIVYARSECSSEPTLLVDVKSVQVLCAGPYIYPKYLDK